MILMRILPTEGNFSTLKIIRDLQNELSFGEAEYKKYQLVQEGDKVHWDVDVDEKEQKDVKIGEIANSIIIGILKDLDDKQKLTQQHLSVFEKFVKN